MFYIRDPHLIIKEQTSKVMAIPGNWVLIAGIENILYPRIKPILEVGFSWQGEHCEHFMFGNRKI
jgi:hypothetical protein